MHKLSKSGFGGKHLNSLKYWFGKKKGQHILHFMRSAKSAVSHDFAVHTFPKLYKRFGCGNEK